MAGEVVTELIGEVFGGVGCVQEHVGIPAVDGVSGVKFCAVG